MPPVVKGSSRDPRIKGAFADQQTRGYVAEVLVVQGDDERHITPVEDGGALSVDLMGPGVVRVAEYGADGEGAHRGAVTLFGVTALVEGLMVDGWPYRRSPNS